MSLAHDLKSLPHTVSAFLPKDIVARIPEDDKLWVKRPAGNLYLPLMFDVSAGVVVNIIRYPVPGVIGRHVHDGPVYSYTIAGSWFYPEHDWVSTPGTFIWEPPGDIHTLTTTGEMTSFYVMHGGLTSVDDNGKTIGYDNVLTLLDYCDKYYRDLGLGADYIRQFVR
jgi:quercetin dioxygenase-like cupin family protein